jgi:hypothetical protein
MTIATSSVNAASATYTGNSVPVMAMLQSPQRRHCAPLRAMRAMGRRHAALKHRAGLASDVRQGERLHIPGPGRVRRRHGGIVLGSGLVALVVLPSSVTPPRAFG